jgi:transposase
MSNAIDAAAAEPEWAAFVAIDWGDQKHCWELQVPGNTNSEKGQLTHTPEALAGWAMQLHARFQGRPIAVCLEQSRGALVYALGQYPHLVLYPVHPTTAAQFRRARHPSGAKSDPGDTKDLLSLLTHHRDCLRRLDPDTPETRKLKILVEQRRQLVDEKTRVSNRITAWLKIYFPQVLDWIDDIDSPLGCDLLLRWPTLEALQRAKPNQLAQFFRQHQSRSQDRIQQRIQEIYAAQPAIRDSAMLEGGPAIVSVWVGVIQACARGIAELDKSIQQSLSAHPDTPLFASFPGVGPALLPRLVAAFGTHRGRFATAADLQRYSGVAPVTEQSGRTKIVRMRHSCPHFVRQTFLEWAAHSIQKSQWARAFYDLKRAAHMGHFAALRALAFKWQRIAFTCWQRGIPYDEQVYLDALQKHRSPVVTRAGWKTVAGFSKLIAQNA